MAGATYELSRHHLGPAACESEIQTILATLNPMARAAGGWTSSVRPPASMETTSLAAALSAWPRRQEEDHAVQALAGDLARVTSRNPSLILLAIEGSGPTMRLAGNAILDNTTREVVLVVGRITAITADRRK